MTKLILTIPAEESQALRFRQTKEEPTLQELQDLVDGYIETVPYWIILLGVARCIAYVNEEGKMRNLPINERATLMWWESIGQPYGDVLCGDVVVVADCK